MRIDYQQHLRKIIVFSILVLVLLMTARLLKVVSFGNWQELHNYSQFLGAFIFRAFRFDVKLLSSLLLIFVWFPLLFSSVIPQRLFSVYLRMLLTILLIVILFIEFIDIGYLYYYQKPIDVLIFGFLEDDTNAIISVILNNMSLVLIFISFILCSLLIALSFSWLAQRKNLAMTINDRPVRQIITWFIILLLLFGLARGSLDTFPLQRKHASVSDNSFINSMVMNSVFNLYYAFSDRKVNNQGVFKQDILQQHGFKNRALLESRAGYSEHYPLLRKTAHNAKLESIKPHVIFILMESWSAHIARKHSAENNVLGAFAEHAKADHFYTQFFANHYATNPSIESLLLNSPITPMSQSVASSTRFKLSSVLPFKRNDYRTLFLSGGYSSWRNHNTFWLNQGFDQYIGRSKIEKTYLVDASNNPWGVYDEYVFKFLQESLLKADAEGESMFSFVLTTNNHPPIRLPDSFKTPSLEPRVYNTSASKSSSDDDYQRSLLAGFHYQTDQLGRFISWIKSSPLRDKVIIVATGDHPQRTFIDNSALVDQYLRYAVPAYFYIPKLLDLLHGTSDSLPGSHNDLFPTLYELSLSNAAYYNFGQPIMEKDPLKAYGWFDSGKTIFSDGVADAKNNLFYSWENTEKFQLNPVPTILDDEKLKSIDQENFKRVLKQYLLVEDYKEQIQ